MRAVRPMSPIAASPATIPAINFGMRGISNYAGLAGSHSSIGLPSGSWSLANRLLGFIGTSTVSGVALSAVLTAVKAAPIITVLRSISMSWSLHYDAATGLRTISAKAMSDRGARIASAVRAEPPRKWVVLDAFRMLTQIPHVFFCGVVAKPGRPTGLPRRSALTPLRKGIADVLSSALISDAVRRATIHDPQLRVGGFRSVG